MRPFGSLLVCSLALGASLAAPAPAQACGGCFHAPSPTAVQVVTDHRMVFSISDRRTILWDQFAFSGRAEEFCWILPVRADASTQVELSDPRFMTAIDAISAPRVNAAPPVPTRFCGGGGGLFATSASDRASLGGAETSRDAGVSVLVREVVGPYDRVTIRSEDPNALRAWLSANGYYVPPVIDPVLDYYVAARMDFVALRLRPGQGINQIQPVRVTVSGSNPTLPLRMISAGVADKVGLLLMVIAPSRMEALGWPNGEIADTDLVYDYDAPSADSAADFLRLFRARNTASGERLWLTESASAVSSFTVSNTMRTTAAVPVSEVVTDDVTRAFEGLGDQAVVTRMRAELGMGALDRDLQLQASDRGLRAPIYNYGTLRNRPPDPLPCGYAEYKGCNASPRSGSGSLGLAGLFGVAALASLARSRRTRRA